MHWEQGNFEHLQGSAIKSSRSESLEEWLKIGNIHLFPLIVPTLQMVLCREKVIHLTKI